MKEIYRPDPLKQNSRVAILAPSGYINTQKLDRVVEAVKKIGLDPVLYPSCYLQHGYLAGTDQERALDINDAFQDKTIDGIIAIRGGYGAHRLLPFLDLKQIKRNKKWFGGYSDITALHHIFNQYCDFQTWHIPMPLSEWIKPLDTYSLKYLKQALFQPLPQTFENPIDQPMEVLSPGQASGVLIGGNLSVLISTLGTGYDLNTKNTILFLEEVNENPYVVDRMLLHLKRAGKISDCNGIILGQFKNCEQPENNNTLSLDTIFEEILGDIQKPVIKNIQCGHDQPTMSIPMGARVRIDTEKKSFYAY